MSLVILPINLAYTNMTRMAAHPKALFLNKRTFLTVTKQWRLLMALARVHHDLNVSHQESGWDDSEFLSGKRCKGKAKPAVSNPCISRLNRQ